MSCIELSVPKLPSIPGLTIPLPSLGLPTLSLDLCCQFVLSLPGIALPPIPIAPALVAALNAYLALLNAYLSIIDFSFDCACNSVVL